MSIAVMKQALEALEVATTPLARYRQTVLKAQIELLLAIEQAEKQEPVAFETWLSRQHGDPEEIGFLQALKISYEAGQDSAPPRKEWVGLTDEEILQTLGGKTGDEFFFKFIRAIEAKLKEKNGG